MVIYDENNFLLNFKPFIITGVLGEILTPFVLCFVLLFSFYFYIFKKEIRRKFKGYFSKYICYNNYII